MNQDVPVIAYLDDIEVGRYDNCRQAAKALYIKCAPSIIRYAYSKEGKRSRGIKSYKTNQRYTFKLNQTIC